MSRLESAFALEVRRLLHFPVPSRLESAQHSRLGVLWETPKLADVVGSWDDVV